jgi:hypothetical protein
VLVADCHSVSFFFVRASPPSPENRIVRPFQVYVGPGKRDYVNMADRAPAQSTKVNIISDVTAESKRRNAAKSDTEYKPDE